MSAVMVPGEHSEPTIQVYENVAHFSAVNLMNCLFVAIHHACFQKERHLDVKSEKPLTVDLVPLDVQCNNPQPVGETVVKNFHLYEIEKYFSKEQFEKFLKLFYFPLIRWEYLETGILRVTLIPKYRQEYMDELKYSITKSKSETFVEYQAILLNMIKAFFYIAIEISKKLPAVVKHKYKIVILEKDVKSLKPFKVQNEALHYFFGFKYNDRLFPYTLFFTSSSFIETVKLMPKHLKFVKDYVNEVDNVIINEKEEIELLVN